MLSFSSEKGYCKMDGIIGQWRHAWDLGSESEADEAGESWSDEE
jgi:hypothetical protein